MSGRLTDWSLAVARYLAAAADHFDSADRSIVVVAEPAKQDVALD